MRASRFLRQRAQLNRSRYAVRMIASEVLPSLVRAMQTMNDANFQLPAEGGDFRDEYAEGLAEFDRWLAAHG